MLRRVIDRAHDGAAVHPFMMHAIMPGDATRTQLYLKVEVSTSIAPLQDTFKTFLQHYFYEASVARLNVLRKQSGWLHNRSADEMTFTHCHQCHSTRISH